MVIVSSSVPLFMTKAEAKRKARALLVEELQRRQARRSIFLSAVLKISENEATAARHVAHVMKIRI